MLRRAAREPVGVRAVLPRQSARSFALLAAALAGFFALLVAAPDQVPYAALSVLVVLSALSLRRGPYLAFCVLVVVGACWSGWLVHDRRPAVLPSVATVVALVPLMAYLLRSRFALGMPGSRPEHLLLELRRRLEQQTDLPVLPAPWHAEAHIAPAYGQTFGGDFIVSSASSDAAEIAIVDVSGNGLGAAARATQLTGALGALIGSVPPRDFLARANDYVLRQGWEDGFATVLHVHIDLVSGDYSLGRAGHLPPLLRDGATGRWSVLEGAGSPPVGVVPDARFPRLSGILGPGDALVLYSDGLVESRTLAHVAGTTRLLRVARAVSREGLEGSAVRMADAAPSRGEDRTVAVVWRDGQGVAAPTGAARA